MTEARKAELELIREKKLSDGISAADSVLQAVMSLKSQLDPSAFWECIYQLGERLRVLECEASESADHYEKTAYGVSLEDIEGKFDDPIEIRDERRLPSDLPI